MHKIKRHPTISVAVGCCWGVEGVELDGLLAAECAGCPLIPRCCDRWRSSPPSTTPAQSESAWCSAENTVVWV